MAQTNIPPIRIDIISDLMCPWCVIGFHQLRRAIEGAGVSAEIHWHPFELNPNMPAGGQDLRRHIAEKHGTTPKDSQAARKNLTELGATFGFAFNFHDKARMWNSFLAHQLVEFADTHGVQQKVNLALLKAHFTDGRNISDHKTLAQIAAECGLDHAAAFAALTQGTHAGNVRVMQEFWLERGITGVPAMVFNKSHLLVGARGVEGYRAMLAQITAAAATPT